MKEDPHCEGEIQDLALRTKQFALRAIKVFAALPKTTEALVLGKQLLRSATSVGAHYREARRAKFDADFVSKVEGACRSWTKQPTGSNSLAEAGIIAAARLQPLLRENDELIAILVSVTKKAKNRRDQREKA